MISKFNFVLTLGILIPTSVWADRVNNGGVGLACYNQDGSITSVQTLDAFEVRLTGANIDLGPDEFYVINAQVALDKLRRLSPRRSNKYSSLLFKLASHDMARNCYYDRRLPPTGDHGTIPELPQGCFLEQLAVRQPDWEPTKEYVFDCALWTKMESEDKAALMLHETIYEEAVTTFGHTSSERSRIFNRAILSGEIDRMSLHEYVKFLAEQVQFRWTDINDIKYRITLDEAGKLLSPEFDENGRFLRGDLWDDQGD